MSEQENIPHDSPVGPAPVERLRRESCEISEKQNSLNESTLSQMRLFPEDNIPPEVLARLREEEDMRQFYARKHKFEERIENVKQTYGVPRPKMWRSLIWLGFAFLVIAVMLVILLLR